MCGPKFCSMRISQDIRNEFGDSDEQARIAQEGMAAKSREFREAGGTVYLPDPSMPTVRATK